MAHKLFIDLQDSTNDNRIIHVRDYSIWDPMLQVKNRLFQVLPPYSDQFYIVPFPENALMSLNGTVLGLEVGQDLPDGAYNYHYSVSPNNKVFISSCHYRVANLMNKVYGKMIGTANRNDEYLDDCGNIELQKDQRVLLNVWMYLNSAAAAGKYSHLKARADELYNLAVKDYNKLYDPVPCVSC